MIYNYYFLIEIVVYFSLHILITEIKLQTIKINHYERPEE